MVSAPPSWNAAAAASGAYSNIEHIMSKASIDRLIIVPDNMQRRPKYMLCWHIGAVASAAQGGTGWCKDEEAPLVGEDERPGQRKRRLLCIDGGGILGTFPAAFLAE
ncbi:MAG: hypothetical protein OXF79_28705, partial [Chloroflexi bacterium]|nr:hypothetical protein [Chloroflexota bacterium]